MELLIISWRNLFRHPRRSILTLLILIIGSTGLILSGGFFNNLLEGFRDVFIHSQTGHMQVSVAGYMEKGESDPFKFLIADVADLEKKIQSSPLVAYTVPRLKFGGMASSENASIPVIALGVDPVRESEMGNYRVAGRNRPSTAIVLGRDLDPSDPFGVLLGKGLLKTLNLQVGSSFNFLTVLEGGAIDGMEYHVRGSFETFVKEFDDHIMKVNLTNLQQLLGVQGKVHNILIVLKSSEDILRAKKELNEKILKNEPNLELILWEEQAQFYKRSEALIGKIDLILQIIIGVTVFLSIANTVNMAFFERIREFGIMMAIGTEGRTIFLLIFLETALLALIGSILGVGVGLAVSHIVSVVGINVAALTSAVDYIAGISVPPSLLVKTFILVLFSALFSCLIPAYRASHLPVTQALAHV